MSEQDKAQSIMVAGPIRAKALKGFGKQMAAWEMAIPPVEPLISDFGLGEFYKVGLMEYWLANEIEAGYCGKYLFLFDGQQCPMHRHKEKLETFVIIKGQVEMDYDGHKQVMGPGEILRVACWKPHSFKGVGPALLLEISKPCLVDDNYFANGNIPLGGNQGGGLL